MSTIIFGFLPIPSKNGAISKVKTLASIKKEVEDISVTEEDSTEDGESSDPTPDEETEISDGSRKSRSLRRKTARSRDESLFLKLAKTLDNRKVGEHRKFEEDRGQSLEQYLKSFEKYCKAAFRKDDNVWVNELEKHLTGETLEAFKGIIDVNDSFRKVKVKLLAWDKVMQQSRKKTAKTTFNRATFKSTETLYLYSTRLEKVFKLAYPRHNKIDSSTILMIII